MCRSCLIESEQQFLRPSDVKNGARGNQPFKYGPPRGWESLKKSWWLESLVYVQSDITKRHPQSKWLNYMLEDSPGLPLTMLMCASGLHKTRARNTLLSDRMYESHLKMRGNWYGVRLWVRLWASDIKKNVGGEKIFAILYICVYYASCITITTWLSLSHVYMCEPIHTRRLSATYKCIIHVERFNRWRKTVTCVTHWNFQLRSHCQCVYLNLTCKKTMLITSCLLFE